MKITITGRNIELTDGLKAAVEEKLGKLDISALLPLHGPVWRRQLGDIVEKYLIAIQECAREYAGGIMKRLREHEYNPDLMRLYVMGGGGCLIRHFSEYDPTRMTINGDINATAKGYERLAEASLRRSKVIV